MKIEEKDGKKLVVFEEGDEELKANFLRDIAEEEEMRKETEKLIQEHDAICKRMKIAMKKLELHRLENNDRIWGPIDEKLKKDLGVEEAPGLSYNAEKDEMSVREGASIPNVLMGILGGLRREPHQHDDEEEGTIH